MTQPLPSLFGRFTAILDHDDLAQTLHRLRVMCAALGAGEAAPSRELAPELLLGQLRANLTTHFSAEESSDYLGVVEDEAPGLAPQIAGLKSVSGASGPFFQA